MQLVSLPKNPAPAGAEVGVCKGYDGVPLRYAIWESKRTPVRGTVCVFPGRAESIEKYFEVIADLLRRGFAVAALDWRGQGGSFRALSDPSKGHVRSFSEYQRDLMRFMAEHVQPRLPAPFIGLGHSMGGAILLKLATEPACPFDRMVLSAPMIALSPRRIGFPEGLTRLYARIFSALGLSRCYVLGGSSQSEDIVPFSGNPATSDPERYARNVQIASSVPELTVGSPTVGWLAAAYKLMGELNRPDAPSRVRIPVLLAAAGADEIVSTEAIETFALRLKVGTHVLIPHSRHEILQERDEVRERFWAAFDAYLGVKAQAA
jgi:lysophospholipase